MLPNFSLMTNFVRNSRAYSFRMLPPLDCKCNEIFVKQIAIQRAIQLLSVTSKYNRKIQWYLRLFRLKCVQFSDFFVKAQNVIWPIYCINYELR